MLPRRQPGLLLISLLNIFLIKSHPKMLATESNGIGLLNASVRTYPMTDYKALCARMADELDHYRQLLMDDRRETHALATEARAALAQPEPEGPSKAELRQIFDDQSGFINDEQVMWWSDFQPAARAVLARWGNL
jgi:hypothetical protein